MPIFGIPDRIIEHLEESMKEDNSRLYPRKLLAALVALVCLSLIACWCSGARRPAQTTPTPRIAAATVVVPTATPVTAPSRQPSATPKPAVTTVSPPKTAPAATPTAATGVLKLVDPPLDSVSPALGKLVANQRFQVLLHEKYVTEQASAYIESASELPIEVRDILISFTPGQVDVSGRVPLGLLRVELFVRGVWRAASCRFEAETVEVRVAGQAAPASLRQQVAKALEDALKSIAEAPVCFTSVEIRQGEVEISGYKK